MLLQCLQPNNTGCIINVKHSKVVFRPCKGVEHAYMVVLAGTKNKVRLSAAQQERAKKAEANFAARRAAALAKARR